MEFSIKQDKQDNSRGMFYLERAQEKVASVEYRMENDNNLVVEYTEVVPSFRGTGAGKQIVDKILRFVESENLDLKSECDYFSKQWDKMK